MDSTNIKTPKLNVSTIKSPLSGGGSDLGGVGQGGTSKVGTLAKIVRKNRISINSLVKSQEVQDEKITRLKNISQIKQQNAGKKSTAGNINSSLAETNKILVAIQNQLALQSQNEQKEEKENIRRESAAESKRKLKREESALEKTAKGIGKAVGKVALKIVQPIGGIFDKILEFVTLLGAGIATNAAFEWFKNEENRRKLTKFFNILKENWQLLAKILGTLVIADLAIKLAGALLTLKSIFKVLVNPLFLAAIGVVAAAMYQGLGENEQRALLELNDDYSEENRERLAKKYEAYKQSLYQKDAFGTRLYGFDTRIDKRIKFLREGVFSSSGKEKKVDWEGLNQGIIDKSEVVDENLLDTFTGGYFTKIWGSQSMPGWQDFRKNNARAMGGPVTAGQSYLVGEGGPEIFSPNINGSIVNNMRTEKIVQTLSSDMGEGNISMMELAPITNQLPPPEISVPSGPATEVPEVSSVNLADPYRQLTPMLYGITV